MLRHQDVIEKLTTEQKLSLLADISSLGRDNLSSVGVQGVRIATFEEVNTCTPDKRFPMFARLVSSWNCELLANVAEALALRAKKTGVTLLETPKCNVKTTPYSDGFSEDPYMAGVLGKTSVQAVSRRGVKTCVLGPALDENDVVFSDVTPSERALNEYFRKPFEIANVREVGIVKMPYKKVQGEYQTYNDEWQEQIADRYPVLVECHTAKETLDAVLGGNKFCLGGSRARIQEAWDHYQSLQASFQAGAISYNDLENECKNGAAISPETLDEAVDKILDFAFECEGMKESSTKPIDTERLLLSAAEESIVLLKNKNGVLPLSKTVNVALIGALADGCDGNNGQGILQRARSLHTAGNIKLVGYAKGYERSQAFSSALIKEAVALAKKANVAVVVMGYDEKGAMLAKRNHTTQLPANQIALIDALAKEQIKTIAVVGGDIYPDMRFDAACAATLLTDIHGSKSAEALWNVLLGKVSPSGKLTCTCYNDTETHFNTLWNYKENKRNKVGVFYGYRHYDTSGTTVKYPFGHGLSYSNFSYSDIWTTAEGLHVNVRNCGKMAAAEVVQVYVGKKNAATARPKKELKAFFKVHLRPGEEKRITVKYKDLDLRIWDESRHAFACEKGEYQVFVGGSSKNISSTRSFHYGTDTIKKTGESLSDYLQAVSNIQKGVYQLDPPVGKSVAKSLLKTGWFTLAILVLCIDVIYGYLEFVGWLPKHWFIYLLVAAITIAPMVMTIKSVVEYRRQLEKERVDSMEAKKNQRTKLNVAELSDEIPFEELFEQEFTSAPHFTQEEVKAEELEKQVSEEKKRIVETLFDKEQSFEKISEDFAAFAYERGVKLDKQSIYKLFSSFAASRLIILKDADKEMTGKFLAALNEYFGVSSTVESCADWSDNDLFCKRTENGGFEYTKAGVLLSSMTDAESKIRMLAFTDVNSARVKELSSAIARYIDHPQRKVSVAVKTDAGENTYELLENMWFVFVLERGASIIDIPKYVLDMATVLELDLQIGMVTRASASETVADTPSDVAVEAATEVSSTTELAVQTERKKTEYKTLSYWQFKKLIDYASRDKMLDEGLWKRVDRLEEFVNGCNAYHIENKQWLRMEKYVSTYLAMGGEAEEALDCAVAQHLIFGIMPCVAATKKPLEEKFTHTVENIFGEGHAPCSLKAVRETGIGV